MKININSPDCYYHLRAGVALAPIPSLHFLVELAQRRRIGALVQVVHLPRILVGIVILNERDVVELDVLHDGPALACGERWERSARC